MTRNPATVHGQISLCLLAVMFLSGLQEGCAHRPWKWRKNQTEAKTECVQGQPQIARRFFVSSQGRMGVNGEAGSFARELTASINAIPNCTAIMLPLDFPVDAPSDQQQYGVSQQLMQIIDAAGPSHGVDELLIVHVTDVVDFRPMRISAVLERRSIPDALPIARDHRTWNAPADMQPMYPNPLNRFILNHPPPAAEVEQMELNRLSPKTFQRTVAMELAQELSTSPL